MFICSVYWGGRHGRVAVRARAAAATPQTLGDPLPTRKRLEAVHGHLDRELLVVVGQHDAEVADLLARLTCAERRGPNGPKIKKETTHVIVRWTRVASTA